MLFQWGEPGVRQENLVLAGMSTSILKKPGGDDGAFMESSLSLSGFLHPGRVNKFSGTPTGHRPQIRYCIKLRTAARWVAVFRMQRIVQDHFILLWSHIKKCQLNT